MATSYPYQKILIPVDFSEVSLASLLVDAEAEAA